MTIGEYLLAVEGAAKRRHEFHEDLAWAQANIINCWTKKKVTAKKLLGKSNPIAFSTEEEMIEFYRQKNDEENDEEARA